jgi:hypothetical protein
MTVNGNEGTFITLEEGAAMTSRYRNSIQSGEILGQFIGKDLLLKIIEQPECEGIRIYYGINKIGEKSLVLVGADSNTNDLTGGLIADEGIKCPPICGNSNALNS